MEERRKVNFDHPESLETDLLISHIQALQRGETVEIPTYDFEHHVRRWDSTITLHPKPIILVEGILIFSVPELVNLFDCKIFVDADSDIRLIRRIQRDSSERGRRPDDVMDQYLSTVRPMHEQYVEPTKKVADIIIPSATNPTSLAMVVDHIHARTKVPLFEHR
jgi:uridine kinase